MFYLEEDKKRYREKIPLFHILFRKCQNNPHNFIYQLLFMLSKKINLIELSAHTNIGPGLYFGHPYCITISPDCIIGQNVNIHKGVTIGRENRGERIGSPTIGNNVWIGINSTIVGKVTIGDDVMIASNSFVNKDIPCHSVVFGNPAIVKSVENATNGYICQSTDN